MIVLPAMPSEQTASWMGLLDLHERLARGWTLIGGQLVHLHCAERGQFPVRPTNDADTVIGVRADPTMFASFTGTLTDLGFTSAVSRLRVSSIVGSAATPRSTYSCRMGLASASACARESRAVRPSRPLAGPRGFYAARPSR